MKVWNLGRMERSVASAVAGAPFCSRMSRVAPSPNRPSKASCVAVHASLHYTAIGFEDSSLLLFKGDITKEK